MSGLVGLGGEQGVELLTHGGRQGQRQLRGEVLLDGAEGLGHEAGQRGVRGHFPAAGPQVIGHRMKHGHGIYLPAGKMGHLDSHGGFDLLEGGHTQVPRNQPAVAEAGGLIVARPHDRAQAGSAAARTRRRQPETGRWRRIAPSPGSSPPAARSRPGCGASPGGRAPEWPSRASCSRACAGWRSTWGGGSNARCWAASSSGR